MWTAHSPQSEQLQLSVHVAFKIVMGLLVQSVGHDMLVSPTSQIPFPHVGQEEPLTTQRFEVEQNT